MIKKILKFIIFSSLLFSLHINCMEQNLDERIPTLTNIVLHYIAKKIHEQVKELKGTSKSEIRKAITSKWLDSTRINEDLIEKIQNAGCLGTNLCVNTIQAFEREKAITKRLQNCKSDSIITCLLSLDNDHIVAGSKYGTLCIWNYKTNKLIKFKKKHKMRIMALILLQNGNFASASIDNTIKLWDDNGNLLNTLKGHENTVYSLAPLENGNIVSAACDATVKVWDPKTGNCLQTIPKQQNFDPRYLTIMNGKYILTHSFRNIEIGNFDLEKSSILQGHSNQIQLLKSLSEKILASSANDNTLRIWDIETGDCLNTFIGSDTPGRSYWATNLINPTDDIVVASFKYNIHVWRLSTGELIHTLEGHTDDIHSLASVSDTILASSSADNTIRVWDINSGKCLHTINSKNITDLLTGSDGLILCASGAGTLYAYYVGNNFEDKLFHLGQPNCIAIETVKPSNPIAPSDKEKTETLEPVKEKMEEECLLQ